MLSATSLLLILKSRSIGQCRNMWMFYNSSCTCSSHCVGKTPLLQNNSVLIREVCFGWRGQYVHSWYMLPRICVLSRGLFFREGPLYHVYMSCTLWHWHCYGALPLNDSCSICDKITSLGLQNVAVLILMLSFQKWMWKWLSYLRFKCWPSYCGLIQAGKEGSDTEEKRYPLRWKRTPVLPPGQWRVGIPYEERSCHLFLRYATKGLMVE